MSKQIPLTRGLFAIVDDEDYERISQHRWHFGKNGYAVRHLPRLNGKRTSICMHHEVMGKKIQTDHRNRDKLDNQKFNLRPCTNSQNSWNCGPRLRSSTGFKGVCKPKRLNIFQAYIAAAGRQHHLGYFRTSESAARAYDAAAKELHGEFAYLNFPETSEAGNQ